MEESQSDVEQKRAERRARAHGVTPAPTATAGSFLLGNAMRLAFGRLTGFAAALQLGFAVVTLTIAWQLGLQPAIDAARYAHYTAHAQGTVSASWIALEFDPAEVGNSPYWKLHAHGTPCTVVNLAGDWGAPVQRAFCGDRFVFSAPYVPKELLSGVPFDWTRDARGFAVPEVRLRADARAWLSSHAPEDPPPHADLPATAYDALQILLDQPVEQAIAGWSAPTATMALAFDPRDPANAEPAGFVETKRHGSSQPSAAIASAMFGLFLWFQGMALLMGGLPRKAMLFAAILPLLALPWWGEQVPRAVERLDSRVAAFVGVMLDGFEHRGRLHASAPRDAMYASEERMRWSLDHGTYAQTLGRMHLVPPNSTPADADAALALLSDTVAIQMGDLDAGTRSALFDRLQHEKRADRCGAGLAFLSAAREAMLDAHVDPAVAAAARGFLDAWTTPPIDLPLPTDAAFKERVRLYRALADIADVEIADGGRAIAERATAPTH
ncbi:MAG: hypothetical protein ABIQ70_05225 [Dokdonella sp.]